MAEEKFGYTNEKAREFVAKLQAYIPTVNEHSRLQYVRSYTLESGEWVEVFREGGSLVLVEWGRGQSSDIEKRVEVYIHANSQQEINGAMSTLTQITGFEPYRGDK